jgi:hypothetical protein
VRHSFQTLVSVKENEMNHTTHFKEVKRGPKRARKGQVLVLACVTMLTMALMLMLSFAVGNAVHERIRLQGYADAQAYSAAVIEARALNSMAYMNRAIAASLVAQMGHHARWTVAEHDINMFEAAATAFFVLAGLELINKPPHFWHSVPAVNSGRKFLKKRNEYRQMLDGKKQDWEKAVGSIQKMVQVLHDNQTQMSSWAGQQVSQGSQILGGISVWNGKHAQAIGGVLGKNRGNFESVFEENPNDKIMASVAMATRPRYDDGSTYNGIHTAHDGFTWGSLSKTPVARSMPLIMNPSHFTDVDDGVNYFFVLGKTKAEVGGGNNTNNVSAETVGGPLVITPNGRSYERFGFGLVKTYSITTNRGQHDYQGTPCGGEACFVNYAGGDGNDVQPVTYGGVSQDLRNHYKGNDGDNGVERAVWETRKSGGGDPTMRATIGSTEWSLAVGGNIDTGYAVSKGKAYFHQLGRWEQPPNIFDPFWRAKLEAFSDRGELNQVLSAAGDSFGQSLSTPVEGTK